MQRNIKVVSISGLTHRVQSTRHPVRVTVLTARTDLRAPGYRIPGCIGPFNRRILGHIYLPKIQSLFVDLNISLFPSKILRLACVCCTARADTKANSFRQIESEVLPLNLGRYTRVFALNVQIPRRRNFRRICPTPFHCSNYHATLGCPQNSPVSYSAAEYSSVHCDSHPCWK